MCGSLSVTMGSEWEAYIARLIDRANETLAGSAAKSWHSRHFARADHTGVGSAGPSFPYRGGTATQNPGPTTFRGDRGASYRRGSGAWDASLLVKNSQAWSKRSDGFVSRSPPIPTASYSRLAEARVHDARLDGMEDRVKLEVQTAVRRDVSVASMRGLVYRNKMLYGPCWQLWCSWSFAVVSAVVR